MDFETLLNYLNTATASEVYEVYKAIIAYCLDLTPEVTAYEDKALNETIDYYLRNDNITSFINDDVLFYARDLLFSPEGEFCE